MAEQLYSRCLNPISFWEDVIPALPQLQVRANRSPVARGASHRWDGFPRRERREPQPAARAARAAHSAQAASVRAHLEELGALDIERPTGRYNLNLSRSIDRLMALRLQVRGRRCSHSPAGPAQALRTRLLPHRLRLELQAGVPSMPCPWHPTYARVCVQEASCRERAWSQHKFYLSWRNATLGGVPLLKEGLGARMREWTLPREGTLKFDFVSYKVRRERDCRAQRARETTLGHRLRQRAVAGNSRERLAAGAGP